MEWYRLRAEDTPDDPTSAAKDEFAAQDALSRAFVLIPATKTRGQEADRVFPSWRDLPSGQSIPIVLDRTLYFVVNKNGQKLIVHRARDVDQGRERPPERNRRSSVRGVRY